MFGRVALAVLREEGLVSPLGPSRTRRPEVRPRKTPRQLTSPACIANLRDSFPFHLLYPARFQMVSLAATTLGLCLEPSPPRTRAVGARMEPDDYEPLVAYMAGVAGRSCTLPFDRIQDLTRSRLPAVATSPGWWTKPDGWGADAASKACLATGWQFSSRCIRRQVGCASRATDQTGVPECRSGWRTVRTRRAVRGTPGGSRLRVRAGCRLGWTRPSPIRPAGRGSSSTRRTCAAPRAGRGPTNLAV